MPTLAWIVVIVLLVAAALVYYFASRDKTGDPVIAPADNISFRVNLPAMAAGQVLIIA